MDKCTECNRKNTDSCKSYTEVDNQRNCNGHQTFREIRN